MIMKGSLHPWIAGLVFLFLFSLQWPRGTAAKPTTTDPINPNSAASAKRNFNSRLGIVILCASFVVLVAIVIVLYKLWEKKKREEQQARFLKLFEEDDDLEVELGLRDEL